MRCRDARFRRPRQHRMAGPRRLTVRPIRRSGSGRGVTREAFLRTLGPLMMLLTAACRGCGDDHLSSRHRGRETAWMSRSATQFRCQLTRSSVVCGGSGQGVAFVVGEGAHTQSQCADTVDPSRGGASDGAVLAPPHPLVRRHRRARASRRRRSAACDISTACSSSTDSTVPHRTRQSCITFTGVAGSPSRNRTHG